MNCMHRRTGTLRLIDTLALSFSARENRMRARKREGVMEKGSKRAVDEEE